MAGREKRFIERRSRVRLCEAQLKDEDFFLRLRNEAGTRKASFSPDRIPAAVHHRWFGPMLRSEDAKLFILMKSRRPVGVLRLNRVNRQITEIHLSIHPRWRRMGFACDAVSQAIEKMRSAPLWDFHRVIAHIKQDNRASIRLFEKLDFRPYPSCLYHHRHSGLCVSLSWEKRPAADILMVVDAGPQTGMGHLMREFSLAEVLGSRGRRCLFYVHANAPPDGEFRRFFLSRAPRGSILLEDFPSLKYRIATQSISLVMIDIRDPLSPEVVKLIRKQKLPIVLIGQYGRIPSWAHLAVDSYDSPKPSSAQTRILTGTTYTIVSREFSTYRKRSSARPVPARARRILILPGGGDTRGMVFKILAALRTLPASVQIDLVLGVFFTQKKRIERLIHQLGCRIHLLSQVPPGEILRRMRRADLAILSFGRSIDEARSVGLPALMLSSSRLNHRGSISADRVGGVRYLGDFRKISTRRLRERVIELLSDENARSRMSRQGRALVDGRGTDRVARVIEKMIHSAGKSAANR